MSAAALVRLALAGMLVAVGPAPAVEYFVTPLGSDRSDGLSRATAFRTIQHGVNVLQAGDTLTIGPGEYFGCVTRADLGAHDRDTLIRAEIPGTVVLRGDVAAPEFVRTDGYRFVYSAAFDGDVQAVNEVDTATILEHVPNEADLEFRVGGCHVDARTKRLSISSSDLQPPDRHHYTVSVTNGFGLLLQRPRRVIVDGLAATGFNGREHAPGNAGGGGYWGILLEGGRQCVVRRCTAYLNGGGIALRSDEGSRDNVIEFCVAFGNYSKHCTEGGNIIGFSTHYDEIRDCYAYKGRPNGFRFYGAGIKGPVVMRRNLGWGSSYTDFFTKGGLAQTYGLAERCISLGIFHMAHVSNCIVGTINQYNRDPGIDTIRYASEARSIRDREFADPDNLDFRLQSDSRFRGRGPGGTDRGPFPYETNVFFVSASGRDAQDGLSLRTPWKTLARAVAGLKPGDTAYLEGGTYRGDLALTAGREGGKPIRICGRGRAPVVIEGRLRVAGSEGVEFERLNFSEGVEVEDSRAIVFKNCTFQGGETGLLARGVKGLRITHTVFAGGGLRMESGDGLFINGNIFAGTKGPAVILDASARLLYSDYNSYPDPERCWRVGGEVRSLSRVREHSDRYSLAQRAEIRLEAGVPVLLNAERFGGRGPLGSALGVYHEYAETPLRVEGPVLHSVGDTTANLEWRSSCPSRCVVGWGETPACTNTAAFETDGFGTFSLTGLAPDTRYYFKLVSADPAEESTAQTIRGVKPETPPLAFRTERAASAPAVYHVSPAGSDTRSGLSPEQAWRTIAHAAGKVRAGDTVLIGSGTYTETIHVRATGAPGRPVTFKAAPGARVLFDGRQRMITTAFSVAGKRHIRFDGFYFTQFGLNGWEGIFTLTQSADVGITRCLFNGAGRGYPAIALKTRDCADVLVRNCVVANGMQGFYLRSTANLRLENNVFMRNMICAFLAAGSPPQGFHISRNIFLDCSAFKVRVALFELSGIDAYVIRDNAFYLRQPDEERKPFLFYGAGPGRLSVAEYDARVVPSGSFFGNPLFRGTLGMIPATVNGIADPYLGDRISAVRGLDFPDVFATHPELVKRGIGLVPGEFADFGCEAGQSPVGP